MNTPRWLFAAAFTAATVVALNQPGGGSTPPAATAAPSLQQLLDRGTDLPFNPDLAAVSCPVERAAVKEGSDADTRAVAP